MTPRTPYAGADDSGEILRRAAAARTATAPAITTPTLQTPATPTAPAPQAPASMGSKIGGGLGRAAGAAIALTNGAAMTRDNQSTADQVGNATGVAQGVLATAAPQTLLNPAIVVPALANAGMDYMKGVYDNVPRDEATRMQLPVPAGIKDIRGPATMEYLKGKSAAATPAVARPPVAEQVNQSGVVATGAKNPEFSAAERLLNGGSMQTQNAPMIPESTVPYEPIKVTRNGDHTTITGSGQSPESRRSMAMQPRAPETMMPGMMGGPAQMPLGPLPTLKSGPGQSIFNALLNLGGDMSKYRDTMAANKQSRKAYNDAMEAGKFNIDAMSKMANIKTNLDENDRKNREAEVKQRAADATQMLASGKFDKEQERGLRILAGLEKGKFSPAVIYGEMDPATGQQSKMTVAVRDDGTVIPLQVPGVNQASAKTVTKSDFREFVRKNGYTEKQAQEFLEKQGYKVGG